MTEHQKKVQKAEKHVEIIRELLQNDKDYPISYKRIKIQYLLNFRWYNPLTWKYYFQYKKIKEKYENK